MSRPTLISQPFDIVVFGGRGDLAKRKLLPALFQLDRDNRLPEDGRIIGASRGGMADDAYRQLVEPACHDLLPAKAFDPTTWERFSKRLAYVGMDATTASDYAALTKLLQGREAIPRVFYLATAPDLFGPITRCLSNAGLLTPTTRIVLEKPLGHDLESSHEINAAVGSVVSEHQIYRIDHYLG